MPNTAALSALKSMVRRVLGGCGRSASRAAPAGRVNQPSRLCQGYDAGNYLVYGTIYRGARGEPALISFARSGTACSLQSLNAGPIVVPTVVRACGTADKIA